MHDSPPSSDTGAPLPELSPAAAVFAEFVRRHDAGEPIDFDAYCAAHPALADKLRRLHRRWREFTDILQGDAAARIDATQQATASLQDGGQRARRYEVGDEVGRGGMSVVRRAFDRDLQRTVAVKVLPSSISTPTLLRRFLAEAKVTGQLQHPGIVPVHDIGVDEAQRVFFVMPLIEGRSLQMIFERVRLGDPEWTLARALSVLHRVCETVAYAHARGVIHRDLKPANVMVGRFGETYVMDWGLARVLRAGDQVQDTATDNVAEAGGVAPVALAEAHGQDSPVQTGAGEVIGTPVYMAPEQARGDRDGVGQAADIYALGAMLYQLLAGSLPYVGAGETPTANEVVARIVADAPPALALVARRAPAQLIAICERAMARVPAQRYPTMQALADDLRAFLEDRVVSAHATGLPAQLAAWTRRNRALAAALGTVLLVLAAGFATSTQLWLQSRANAERAQASGRQLATQLSATLFAGARSANRLGDLVNAMRDLWQEHLAGTAPRATHWALWELYQRNPCLTSLVPGDEPRGRVYLALLADGALVVTGDRTGSLRFYDGTTLQLRDQWPRQGPVLGLDVVNGSSHLAVSTTASIEVWNVAERRVVRQFDVSSRSASQLGELCFSADGELLAANRGNELGVWQWRTGKRLVANTDAFGLGLAFDPAGRWLAVGRNDGGIELIDLSTCSVVRTLRGHQQEVTALAFAPDDRRHAGATAESDTGTGGNGTQRLWSGAVDRTLRLWSLADGVCLRSEPSANGTLRDILPRRRADTLLVCGWNRIEQWDASTLARQRFASIGGWYLRSDSQERWLWQSTADDVRLWELAPPRDRVHLEGHQDRVLCALDPGGQFAWTGDGNGTVRLFELPSGRLVQSANAHARRVLQLNLDPTGELLASVAEDGAKLFDARTLTPRSAGFLRPPDDLVRSAAFDARGRMVTGTMRGWLQVHEVGSGICVGQWHAADGFEVLSVAFTPDGKRVLATTRSPTRRLLFLDLATGRSTVLSDVRPDKFAAAAWRATLSPDGRRIAVATFARLVLVLDAATGEVTHELAGHAGAVWGVAFHPTDPDLLVSSAGDGTVCFWDLESKRQCARFEVFDGDASVVDFDRSGNWLAVSGLGGAQVWDLTYYDRHIAGNLQAQLARAKGAVTAERAIELNRWAATVMAQPWPVLPR